MNQNQNQRQFTPIGGGSTNQRWEPQKWPNPVDPNNKPFIEGYLKDFKEVTGGPNGPFMVTEVATLNPDGTIGESFDVSGGHVMDDKISKITLGSYIRIEFGGKMPSKTPGRSYNVWDVFVDSNAIPYAQLGGAVRQTQAAAPVFNNNANQSAPAPQFNPNGQQQVNNQPPVQQQQFQQQGNGQPVFQQNTSAAPVFNQPPNQNTPPPVFNQPPAFNQGANTQNNQPPVQQQTYVPPVQQQASGVPQFNPNGQQQVNNQNPQNGQFGGEPLPQNPLPY